MKSVTLNLSLAPLN